MARSAAQLRAIFAALAGKGVVGRGKWLQKNRYLSKSRDARGALRLTGSTMAPLGLNKATLMRALGGLKKGVRPFNSALQKQGKTGLYKGGQHPFSSGGAMYPKYRQQGKSGKRLR